LEEMTKRERLIELARIGRMIPGGPTGELHERERVLAMLGIPAISIRPFFKKYGRVVASSASFRKLRERSAKRRVLWTG
jgi:hypothetical protein